MGAPSTPRRPRGARPLEVTVVGIVAMVLGSMMLVGSALLVTAGTLQGPWGNFHEFGEIAFWLPSEAISAGIFLGVVGAAHLATGAGLVRGRPWALYAALTLIGLQVVSGLAAVARGELGQVTQAGAYAVAAWALATPRARAWLA